MAEPRWSHLGGADAEKSDQVEPIARGGADTEQQSGQVEPGGADTELSGQLDPIARRSQRWSQLREAELTPNRWASRGEKGGGEEQGGDIYKQS